MQVQELVPAKTRSFRPAISCSNGSGQCMAIGTFCGQTMPISISRVLSILKIAEYGQEKIRSKCKHCLFVLKRSLWGEGLRQHLSLVLSFSRRLVFRVLLPVQSMDTL
ncbi:hypothetical protein AVEN_182672-1 [Araneus ventricosus]|uniref:Uncharacterized protein n=1 Tax=Araneus ventricosus TaxID=182803 RepID=A0A4Y2L810_ARAVE|nr:hypothetical protein AVEN_182672-1 [Araneus ventricosus]